MTLIVEDGTGLTDANSYASLDEANTYFAGRPLNKWSGDDATKEGALRMATEYIDARFGARFVGTRKTETQRLEWPRLIRPATIHVLPNGLPSTLPIITCLYAEAAVIGVLYPDLAMKGVVRKREKVGPLEEETQYVAAGLYARGVFGSASPLADALIKALLKTNGAVGSTIRN